MSNLPGVKAPCPEDRLPSVEESGEKSTHIVVYWSPPLSPEVRQLLNERIREFRKFGTGVQLPGLAESDEEKE